MDGLMQEKRNSIVYALELRLSCTNPLKCLNIKYMDKYLHCDGVDIGVHSFVFFQNVYVMNSMSKINFLLFCYFSIIPPH